MVLLKKLKHTQIKKQTNNLFSNLKLKLNNNQPSNHQTKNKKNEKKKTIIKN